MSMNPKLLDQNKTTSQNSQWTLIEIQRASSSWNKLIPLCEDLRINWQKFKSRMQWRVQVWINQSERLFLNVRNQERRLQLLKVCNLSQLKPNWNHILVCLKLTNRNKNLKRLLKFHDFQIVSTMNQKLNPLNANFKNN